MWKALEVYSTALNCMFSMNLNELTRRPTISPIILFRCLSLIHTEKSVDGAGEMALQLRALAVLAEDPDLVPSTHVTAHNHLSFQFQEELMSFLAPWVPRICYTYIHADTHTHRRKITTSLKDSKKRTLRRTKLVGQGI